MEWILLITLCIYEVMILFLALGQRRMFDRGTSRIAQDPVTGISMIIPFRNEEQHLKSLLDSILKLDYPGDLLQVILVDDGSTDGSRTIIEPYLEEHPFITVFNSRRQSASPKKDALEVGLEHARHEWIYTSDADCILPPDLLRHFSAEANTGQKDMICGPVTYSKCTGFFQHFQLLDFMALMATTAACFGWKHPIMCNGANLMFRHSAFKAVGGYGGNKHQASGDDVFLLRALFRRKPESVCYLPQAEALVQTQGCDSFSELIHQRVRWGSKTGDVGSFWNSSIAALTFLGNFSLLLLPFFAAWTTVLGAWALKLAVDATLLFPAYARYQQQLPRHYLLAALLYPAYLCLIVFRIFAGDNYQWKGRKFNTRNTTAGPLKNPLRHKA